MKIKPFFSWFLIPVLLIVKTETRFGQTSPAFIADKAFTAWYNAYNIESVDGFFRDNAEMMEVVLDAYEVTKDPKYKTMFEAMYKNFIAKNGADWQDNKYTKEASYLSEATKIALYIRDEMYKGEVMNNEDNGNDLPGFKGIFARYARMYKIELNKTELVEWLQLNAKVAWNNRNSQNLIQTRWATKTDETKPKSAFGCSTAVSLLMNTLPLTTIK